MSGLEQALGRLRNQPPVLQPLGVHAVFDLISAASSPSPAAITACLGVSSPVRCFSCRMLADLMGAPHACCQRPCSL